MPRGRSALHSHPQAPSSPEAHTKALCGPGVIAHILVFDYIV